MKPRMFYVYIQTNNFNTVFYVGFTNNLCKRHFQHKEKLSPDSFTARYNLNKLVYYEIAETAYAGISREKQIKGWKRYKKVELVSSMNPDWKDLSDQLEN